MEFSDEFPVPGRAGKRKAGAWMKTGAKVTPGWDSPKFFARYFFENSSAYRNRQ